MGIKFFPFNRRENRRSLAIFFAEEIAHLGALKIARFCGGAVKIAAATAENRAILVHSVLGVWPSYSKDSDKRATTNVQNGLVFFFLFSLKRALILRESLGDKF